LFKGLGNIASILRNAQEMGQRMQAIKDRLRAQRVTGASGGGMVEVEVNGAGEVLKMAIEPSLVERGDREMIEDLVPAAVNQALAKARQLHAEEMKAITDGLDIPGVGDAIAKLMGGDT
jgi:DNA-binding YbaB/EbfC family protein